MARKKASTMYFKPHEKTNHPLLPQGDLSRCTNQDLTFETMN